MDNNLTEGNIGQLMKSVALPASIGFFFNTMYNVVDTYYGGLISTEALAALSLSFPVFFLIIAFGSGIGSGTTAIIGHALGEGDKEKAKHFSIQAISFSTILSLILTILALLISPSLFRILGAEGNYLELALSYTNVIFYGTVFFMATFLCNAILNAAGDTKTYGKFLIVGFFLNLILDPWFMFGWLGFPKLGLAGVAWATVVIQIIGTLYLLSKVIKAGFISKNFYRDLKPEWKTFKEISIQGFPSSFSMMSVAIGIFIITYFIKAFGSPAVAAYGIATRIEQIALLPTIGVNIAALALVAQNAGARKFDRVKEVVKKAFQYNTLLLAPAAVLVYFFADKLMSFFTTDTVVVEIGTKYLHIAILIFLAYGILFASDSIVRGLKKPQISLVIGVGRQIILPLTFFYLTSKVWGFDIRGIWWSIFLINWVGALLSLWYLKRLLRKSS